MRIVCRELESWYFGDLAAVESALGVRNLVRYSRRQQYRIPDEIMAPARELMKITNNAYQKVSGSRAIGPHISYQDNNSHSFGVFMESIHTIVRTDVNS